jgi:hypothetical protein
MIFAGESVVAGSLFAHGFIAQNVTPVEFGSLLYALGRWQADGATLGGQSARGHGRLRLMAAVFDGELREPGAYANEVSLYKMHVAEHVAECRAFLAEAFAEETAKPKRGRKQPVASVASLPDSPSCTPATKLRQLATAMPRRCCAWPLPSHVGIAPFQGTNKARASIAARRKCVSSLGPSRHHAASIRPP